MAQRCTNPFPTSNKLFPVSYDTDSPEVYHLYQGYHEGLRAETADSLWRSMSVVSHHVLESSAEKKNLNLTGYVKIYALTLGPVVPEKTYSCTTHTSTHEPPIPLRPTSTHQQLANLKPHLRQSQFNHGNHFLLLLRIK